MITKSQIDERSITQPYIAGRCWFRKRVKDKDGKMQQVFCGEPAKLFAVERSAKYRSANKDLLVRMWACSEHKKRLCQDESFVVTEVTWQEP